MSRKYAIYPYWVHVLIAASMTKAFAWFLFWLGDWSFKSYHRPYLGLLGIFLLFTALMFYIENKCRRLNKEYASGNIELRQR